MSRNPFLFRGPIPTNFIIVGQGVRASQSLLIQRSYSYGLSGKSFGSRVAVAIPSYSEVLFLPEREIFNAVYSDDESQSLLIQRSYSYHYGLINGFLALPVAIPSYSEVLFLLGQSWLEQLIQHKSQSLLIQRSYSYAKKQAVNYSRNY